MTATIEAQPEASNAEDDIRVETSRRLGRPFWRLWSASTASHVGDGLTLVALPLLAASLTGNAGIIAGVAAVQRLPWLLLALPSGALADRWNRGLVMAIVDFVRAGLLVVLGVCAATGTLTIGVLYTLAFVLGALETLFTASANAALPKLVDTHDLDRSNGLMFASEMAGTQMAGPAVGGLLFAAAASVPFIGDGITFLVSGVLLLPLRGRLAVPARRTPGSSPAGRPRIMTEMSEGVRFFVGHRVLRLVAALVAGLAFCQAMVMGILVVFGLRVLHLSPAGYGLFLGIGAIGNVAGGLLAGRVRAQVGTAGVLLGSAAAAAVAYLVCASTSSVAVAGGAFLIETFAVACGSVASLSLRQSLVPDELQGRVGNAFRMCIWGVIPIGTVVGGALAQGFDARVPFVVAGVAQLALTAVCARPLRARLASGDRVVAAALSSLAPAAA